MCRFVFYLGTPIALGSLLTEPANSLIHQSFHSHEREEPLNGDGFGVAWYVPGHEEPACFRSVTPAWSNQNLRDLARVTTSACVLAHVRAATQSLQVSEANCHPFRRGRYAFMHNGDLGGFEAMRRPLLAELSDEAFAAIHGTTDSEHFFALLGDGLDRLGEPRAPATMAEAFRQAVERVLELRERHAPVEHVYLNAVLSDGHAAVACRFTTDEPGNADSLYRHCGRRYTCEEGVCRMVHTRGRGEAAIVSSEPLSEDGGWEAVPVNHFVLLEGTEVTAVEPVLGPA
jgi:predicted glutamine amidotransferase